jgi:hypothetical protein
MSTGPKNDALFEDAAGREKDLYLVIGFYMRWSACVEQELSRNLAHLLGVTNFEVFDALADRMGTMDKCNRIEDAGKSRLGPNFTVRLKRFKERYIKTRNLLAHRYPMLEGRNIHFTTIGAMHAAFDDPTRPSQKRPPSISISQLRTDALWLKAFYSDLNQAAIKSWNDGACDGMCEIDHPETVV